MTNSLIIATEIRNQIGAKTLFMLGAKDVYGSDTYLSFKIRGSKAFNHIKIELMPDDTYSMTFSKVRSISCTNQETVEGVYADMMHEIIEQKTCLRTSL